MRWRRLSYHLLCLPFPLSRLIVYGILFGVECDGVVFAAAIQCKDPFNLPTKKIIKDDDQFISSLDLRYVHPTHCGLEQTRIDT